MTAEAPTGRGTSNASARGSSYARRARRRWLIENYASDVPGYCRCYRCGVLLYDPGDPANLIVQDAPPGVSFIGSVDSAKVIAVDRIIPGCQGGTYRRTNIRPACGTCNSETGGRTRGRKS